MKELAVKKIQVGSRIRKDLGDIRQLADSIREVGLLHPIVIRHDGVLVAGERRLAACKSLGWQKVPVTIINIEAIVHGEFAENVHRKDFLLSEIDAIRRAMEPIVRAAAKDAHARESKQTVCIVIVATVLRETANSQVLRP